MPGITLLEASATGIKARVVLDTHSGSLDGMMLEQAMSLQPPSGADLAATAIELVTGGGHHRQAVVVFPAPARATLEEQRRRTT